MALTPTYIGTMSNTAISYAKDYVTGSTQDYLFFQTSANDYYLFFSDSIEINSNGVYYVASPVEFHIVYDQQNFQNPNDEPTNWRIYRSDYQVNTYFEFLPYNGELFYCSIGENLRLREGGEFYGFSAICCMLLCFGFVLVSRIFKRLF